LAALAWLNNLDNAGSASGPVTITVADADVFFSPYNWYKSGSTYALTNTPGAYIKTRFTGTSFKLNVDVSELTGASTSAGDYPRILYSVNGGAWTSRLLTSADTQITLATGLADSTHNIEITFAAVAWASEDRWTTPVMALKITGFEVDTGKDVATPTTFAGRMLVYGDSHTEGHEALAAGVSVTNQDASQAFPILLARAFECEVGIIGFAGQGYTAAIGSNHNLVDVEAAWDEYYSGQSRLSGGLLDPAPDYIVTSHGTNDSGASDGDVTTAVENLIGAWRTAAPDATIFVALPPALIKESAIRSGVTNAADANTFVIDHGEALNVGRYYNGDHLSVRGHAWYGAALIGLAKDELNTGGGGVATSPIGVGSAVIRGVN